jgi:hypothetical protein
MAIRFLPFPPCADHVDAGLFHQFQIADHVLPVDMFSGPRMLFVPVYAFQLNRLAIDRENISLNFNFSHTKVAICNFQNFVFRIFQG